MDLSQYTTVFAEEEKQFRLQLEEGMAYIDFILNKQGTIFLTHTEVPSSLEGKGVGKKIVEDALNYIEMAGWKLAPLCPFVAAYLKKHPQYSRILAPGYNI